MAANGLAALGLTLVVIVRKFDLSFAGTACFSAMTIGFMIAGGHDLWLCIMTGVLAAAVVGAFNGIAISYFGLPDIVTTIATGSIAGGLAFLYSQGRTIFRNFVTSGILDLNDARLFGYSASFFFLIALYAVAWVFMHRTRYGASFHATGENPVSAYFSGVPVRTYTMMAFIICAITSVFAVVLILAESGTADTNKGATLLMPAYAGVFLGAALLGGTSVLATLAGTLLITMLLDGFSLLGVPYYYSDGVVSAILLTGVVLFDARVRQLFSDLASFIQPVTSASEKRS
jgi:ribose/xylose/arabinose/galactoside ABC-type transport system permease subunit